MALSDLLYLHGIGDEYVNYKGENIVIPDEDREGVLRSLISQSSQVADADDIDTPLTESQIQTRIDELVHQPWLLPLPRFQYCYLDQLQMDIVLSAKEQGSIKLSIVDPQGQLFSLVLTKADLLFVDKHDYAEQQYIQYRIKLSNTVLASRLVMGYHQVSLVLLNASAERFVGRLMIAPRQAFRGHFYDDNSPQKRKPWGVNIQLYSLRSKRQWGIGDFYRFTSINVNSCRKRCGLYFTQSITCIRYKRA